VVVTIVVILIVLGVVLAPPARNVSPPPEPAGLLAVIGHIFKVVWVTAGVNMLVQLVVVACHWLAAVVPGY